MFKKTLMAAALAGVLPALLTYPSVCLALPSGPVVVVGSAQVSQAGSVMTVTNGAGAVLNWGSFGVGSGETLVFNQPSAASSVLNRVVSGDPSLIHGRISSNGSVWLVNPAGIMVGPGGRIDTAGFVATTLAVSNADFLAGKRVFGDGSPGGAMVSNKGVITTPDGGSVFLVGPKVENSGVILASGGEVVLAAGHTVRVGSTSSPGVLLEITAEANTQGLNLSQMLSSGAVYVSNTGRVSASSVERDGGRVFLRAAQNGGAMVNAGLLEATGGNGGQGGFVDTSGAYVELGGRVEVGRGGTWLIDPYDITIGVSPSFNASAIDAFGNYVGVSSATSNGMGSTLLASDLAAQLNAGVNVVVDTHLGTDLTPNNGTEAGNITVASLVYTNASAPGSLTLKADGGIAVNAGIVSSAGPMSVSFVANQGVGVAGLGSVVIKAAIDTAGGNFTVKGANGISFGTSAGSINAGAGKIELVAGTGGVGLQLGVLTAQALAVRTKGGLNATNASNSIGSLTVDASGSASPTVAVRSSGSLLVTTQMLGGSLFSGIDANGGLLELSSGGSITQDARVSTGSLLISQAGLVDLSTSPGNGIRRIAGISASGPIRVADRWSNGNPSYQLGSLLIDGAVSTSYAGQFAITVGTDSSATGLAGSYGGDLVISPNGYFSAPNGTGVSIVLGSKGGNFVNNNPSASVLSPGAAGYWRVSSMEAAGTVLGALVPDFQLTGCSAQGLCEGGSLVPAQGNGVLYAPTALVVAAPSVDSTVVSLARVLEQKQALVVSSVPFVKEANGAALSEQESPALRFGDDEERAAGERGEKDGGGNRQDKSKMRVSQCS